MMACALARNARERGTTATAATALLLVSLLAIELCADGAKVLELNAANLPRVIEKHKKLLCVEFYAPDCAHCQLLEPVLERAADDLKGNVSIVKVDTRTAHDLNRKYKVRQTPTMVLFRDGIEIAEARADIQGYRTEESLIPYLRNYVGPDVAVAKGPKKMQRIVEERGLVVCSLLPEDSVGYANFVEIARRMRGHLAFATAFDDGARARIADAFGVETWPGVFIAKRSSYAKEFGGDVSDRESVESFVSHHGFPLVGNFSILTYYRYHRRDADRVYLFYDAPEDETLRASIGVLERVAMDYDEISFMGVSSTATETGSLTIMQKSGLSDFDFPAVAVADKSGNFSYAHSQMTPFNETSVRTLLDTFYSDRVSSESGHLCLNANSFGRTLDVGDDVLSKYGLFVERQKAYWRIDDNLIKEANRATYKKRVQKSWKDVLVVYTARWW